MNASSAAPTRGASCPNLRGDDLDVVDGRDERQLAQHVRGSRLRGPARSARASRRGRPSRGLKMLMTARRPSATQWAMSSSASRRLLLAGGRGPDDLLDGLRSTSGQPARQGQQPVLADLGLEAAGVPAAALGSVGVQRQVADLPGVAARPGQRLAADDEAAPHADAAGEVGDVVAPDGHPAQVFGPGAEVGVVVAHARSCRAGRTGRRRTARSPSRGWVRTGRRRRAARPRPARPRRYPGSASAGPPAARPRSSGARDSTTLQHVVLAAMVRALAAGEHLAAEADAGHGVAVDTEVDADDRDVVAWLDDVAGAAVAVGADRAGLRDQAEVDERRGQVADRAAVEAQVPGERRRARSDP